MKISEVEVLVLDALCEIYNETGNEVYTTRDVLFPSVSSRGVSKGEFDAVVDKFIDQEKVICDFLEPKSVRVSPDTFLNWRDNAEGGSSE